MSVTTRLLAILLTLLGCLFPAKHWLREERVATGRTFVVPPARLETNTSPFFRAEFISPEAFTHSVHVASICETPDGRFFAAWYGGTREGAKDVKIFLSVCEPGTDDAWSAPRPVASVESAEAELKRPIRKVGNAVLFAGGAGQLGLIYVTISIGGWSGSSLNFKTSRDAGQTWSATRRLTLSPFFNISELVKNNPLPLSDGSWAAPIYHELLGKFSEVLWLSFAADGGEVSWKKTRVSGGRTGFQPALVAVNPHEALALLRDYGSDQQIHLARSLDAGQSWQSLTLTGLPNPHSGLDAIRLSDGRILLAVNDNTKDRSDLSLVVSNDGGRTWVRRAVIEREPGSEFSYPYLIQSRDSLVHLVYTWKRERIKHVAFNTAWLDSSQNK
jgi:predicted neuraminidase